MLPSTESQVISELPPPCQEENFCAANRNRTLPRSGRKDHEGDKSSGFEANKLFYWEGLQVFPFYEATVVLNKKFRFLWGINTSHKETLKCYKGNCYCWHRATFTGLFSIAARFDNLSSFWWFWNPKISYWRHDDLFSCLESQKIIISARKEFHIQIVRLKNEIP